MNDNDTATLTLPKTETTDATLALREEILRLKAQRRAVILAHNYQVPDIQDLADYVGDSLGLARQAAENNAETIFRAFRESLFVSNRPWRSRRRREG